MRMKNSETTLTVIIPVSRLDWLKECLDSVQLSVSASAIDTEVLLVDTRKKTKPTLSKAYSNEFLKIRTICLPGATYGEALDFSKFAVNSKYVALMNDDDLVTADRFSSQYMRILSDDAEICVAKFKHFGDRKISLNLQPLQKFTYEMLFLGPYCANATSFMETSFFQNLPSLKSENWDWNVALLNFKNARITYLPKVVYLYRQHEGQTTREADYRSNLFDSMSPQLTQSFQAFSGKEISNSALKALAFPYLSNRVKVKEFVELIKCIWYFRQVFFKAPIWASYQFTARFFCLALNMIRLKNGI
jgi:hypothetical protein